MKRIEAIVRPERLEAVKDALRTLEHHGLTVSEVKGHGIQRGVSEDWQGETYTVALVPKVSIVAVVNDYEAQECIDAIVKAARTDRMGDGKIFVTPVEQVVRVRTGERGSEAL
jgi:nitrogen regulatory protein P-II 1